LRDNNWLSGTAPRTGHTDLMANNLTPDPFKDLNEKKVEWVAQRIGASAFVP